MARKTSVADIIHSEFIKNAGRQRDIMLEVDHEVSTHSTVYSPFSEIDIYTLDSGVRDSLSSVFC